MKLRTAISASTAAMTATVLALALIAASPAGAAEKKKPADITQIEIPEDLLEASEANLKKSRGLLGTLLANYKDCRKRGKTDAPCVEPFLERRASDKARDAIDYFTKSIRDQKAARSYAAKLQDARTRSKDKSSDKELAAEYAAKVPAFKEKTKTLRAKAERFYRKGMVRYDEAMVRHQKFQGKNPGLSANGKTN